MKNCFIISPIGEVGSETRKRSNQVLKHIIEPALAECSYRATRADLIDDPGIITSQIIRRIVEDDLVLADLTEKNPNVFYELALRHAIKKPVIQIIHKSEKLPFDVSGSRTISFDHQDLDSVAEARENISKQIRAMEAMADSAENPISVALEVAALKLSSDPLKNGMAEVLDSINYLGVEINKIRHEKAGYALLPYVERLLIYYKDLTGMLELDQEQSWRFDTKFTPEQVAILKAPIQGIQKTIEGFCIEQGYPRIAPKRLE